MDRIKIRFITDLLLFCSFSTLLFTGFLLWLAVPTGKTGNPYFMGLHRHSWGDIHLFFSLVFAAGVFFHIYLNWSWAITFVKKFLNNNIKYLLIAGTSFIPLTIAAWLFKLIFK